MERYNRTYRTEVLNAYVFESLGQGRNISTEWLQSYNEERPHDAFAGLPPAMYRANVRSQKLSFATVSLTGKLTQLLGLKMIADDPERLFHCSVDTFQRKDGD